MKNKNEQKNKELDIFLKFLKAVNFNTEKPIIQDDPPKPDIICQMINNEVIGFELREVIDTKISNKVAISCFFKIEMKQYSEMLSTKEREVFKNMYHDADIHFSLKKMISRNKLKNNFKNIYNFLLSLENKYTGKVSTIQKGYPKYFAGININRGIKNGPFFNLYCAQGVSNGMQESLENKFKKRYICEFPIELILYSDLHAFFDKEYLLKTKEFLEKNLKSSPFRRVWFFEANKLKIDYVYPEY